MRRSWATRLLICGLLALGSAHAFAQTDPRVFDEPGRVLRMHCKDFLWEYDFLLQVSGPSAQLQLDLMPQTALLEAAKRASISPDQLFREAAKTGRGKPEDAFIESVFARVVSSQARR